MKNLNLNILIASALAFEGCSRNQIVLKPIDINASEPSIINVLFSAELENGKPIHNLNLDDLIIYEDEEILSDRNRTFQTLLKGEDIKNISRQIIAVTFIPSEEDSLENLKKSLELIINNIDINDKNPVMILAIGETIKIVADFLTNKDDLLRAISLYPRDLSGNINLNENIYKLRSLLTGGNKFDIRSLLMITNQRDKAKRVSNHDLNRFMPKNSIFTIGIGDDVDEVLLEEIGGGGNLSINNSSEIEENLEPISSFFNRTGKNIYLLQYASPKRKSISGNSNHTFTLTTLDDGEIGNSKLVAKFNSAEFSPVKPTIKLSKTGKMSNGEDLILKAETLWTTKKGQYEWIVGDQSIVMPSIKSDDSSEAIFHFGKNAIGKTAILVRDLNNEVEASYPVALGVYAKSQWNFQDGKIPSDFKFKGSNWEIWKEKSNTSLKSPKMGDNESSSIYIKGYFEGTKIAFNYKIESEDGCDEMIFSIDGVTYKDSGFTEWSKAEYPIQEGEHIFEWKFVKDSSNAKYQDSIWIDNITIK